MSKLQKSQRLKVKKNKMKRKKNKMKRKKKIIILLTKN